MFKAPIIALFLSFCTIQVFGQSSDNFKISITIKGAEDSFLTIGYHLGDKQYIKDTILTDKNGHGVYSGTEPLDVGLYIVLLPDNRYFDLIVDSDQVFDITCSRDDIVGTMIINGSAENQDFIEYQRAWMSMQSRSQSIRRRMQNNASNSDSSKIIKSELSRHDSEMLTFLKTTASKKPDSFLSLLVKALIPVEVPDFESSNNSFNQDSLRWLSEYNYNVAHYFDNIDLNDYRLIRTPVLHGRLKSYFTNIVSQHPDSLNRIIPRIIDMSGNDSIMYRYLVVFAFNHFRESPIMGHDGITVKIIDDYYLSGKADWISEETLSSLRDDADRLRTNLIGGKAVDLVMETFSGQHRSVYDITKDFTILYFWEPNCGHCKTSTPLLNTFYKQYRNKDVEVFAICTQDNKEEWEGYIAEYELDWINGWDPNRQTHFDFYYNVTATPLIYILDKNKTIIAKKIAVENIEDFLNNFRKFGL